MTTTNDNCTHPACSLTGAEFRERRETVIAALRQDVLEVRETQQGYTYRFSGTDDMLLRLAEFIRTERMCCAFFTFTLTVGNAQSDIWLELSGPDGTKEFIRAELGM